MHYHLVSYAVCSLDTCVNDMTMPTLTGEWAETALESSKVHHIPRWKHRAKCARDDRVRTRREAAAARAVATNRLGEDPGDRSSDDHAAAAVLPDRWAQMQELLRDALAQ